MPRAPQPDQPDLVQARESGVVAHPAAPGGEFFVREGTIYKRSHPAVQRCGEWFVDLGDLATTGPYIPHGA